MTKTESNGRPGFPPTRLLAMAVLVAVVMGFAVPSVAADVRASYLYSLSNFTGTIPFTWARVVVDEAQREVYVAEAGSVSVFNQAGMEVYQFGSDGRLGVLRDLAPLESGDILLLSYPSLDVEAELLVCDYRGEVRDRLALTGLLDGQVFRPSRMALRGEKLYLADPTGMKAAVADRTGQIHTLLDLAALIGLESDEVADAGLGGFDADARGSLYFTVPTEFRAYRLSAEGKVESFGKPGSGPGRFGVVAGIAADRSGNIFVVDTLKSAVMVFDGDFGFLTEFGYRSGRPEGLVSPRDPTVSGDGRLYVTQQARRGVNVYRMTSN